MRLYIENLTCGHCVRAITQALHAIAPSITIKVDLPSKPAEVPGPLAAPQMVAALEEEGYTATLISEVPGSVSQGANRWQAAVDASRD